MQNLVYTSTIILITAVITAVGVVSLVDTRIEEEQRLTQQIATEVDALHKELAQLYQRIDQLGHTGSTPAKMVFTEERPSADTDEALRDLVRNMVNEERAARLAATRNTQWERLRNWQDNRKGPYGKYNVRVNSISKTLDLDYTQASYYHTLLSDYEEQANALYEGVSSRLPDQGSDFNNFQTLLGEIELEKRRLDATFDQAFAQTLSPAQASRYEQLPPEERGVGPNAGLDRMQFQFSDLRRLAAKE